MDNQLPQVTYLFGAGASAQVLPTIKELPKRILRVRDYINSHWVYTDDEEFTPYTGYTFKKNEAKTYLLECLANLYEYSHNHSTIDTYAKKLNIRNEYQKVSELVFSLAVYFCIEQKTSGVDPRYDTFLISLLNNDTSDFPTNLKFLSWNYDLQLEAAHAMLAHDGTQDISYRSFSDNIEKVDKNKFTSIKLNGCSSCADKDGYRLTPLIHRIGFKDALPTDLDFTLSLAYFHLLKKQKLFGVYVNINFAWYKSNDEIERIAEAYNLTEVLVAVGYSFPFFNREVDRTIIRRMENLKKIYIQDLAPENIKSRFLSILPDYEKRGIQIIPVKDVGEFFLPPEL